MDKLKLVETVRRFKGGPEEDLEQWLDRFETAVKILSSAADDAARSKEMAAMMPLFLDGPAFSTWSQLEDAEKKDFGEIKSALRRVFGLGKAAAWQRLKSLHLFPGESVDVMVNEAKTLLRTITNNDPSGELVSLTILDAVPAEIREKVYMQHGEDMKLPNVISSIKALLATEDVRATVAASAHQPSSQGSQRSFNWSSRCQGCLRQGHRRSNCLTICYRCGDKGHLLRNCPLRLEYSTASGNDQAGAAAADSATPASRN